MQNYLAKIKKEVIVSTGMATLKEIENVVNIYKKTNINNLFLLHCVSNYPCSIKSLNLKSMKLLKKFVNNRIGYSDHSEGNIASIVAVTLGAKIIEKHFTLDKSMSGPDHKASSSPEEFKSLIEEIRKTEDSLGSSVKVVQSEEYGMKKISRKSIVYSKNLTKNHVITKDDITLKRPGTGLYSDKMHIFLNKKILSDVKKDQILKPSDFDEN